MTWLITESSFELVVGQDCVSLHGYTRRHEWLAYSEEVTPEERHRISRSHLSWEICPAGLGRLAHYVSHFGQEAEKAMTAVAMPNEAIIVLAEISESRWVALLRAFEFYTTATYPKHFRINVPFETLSTRGQRSAQLEQFLSGAIVNTSDEEASAVFFHGTELPEMSQ
jgi:hypothetical protein